MHGDADDDDDADSMVSASSTVVEATGAEFWKETPCLSSHTGCKGLLVHLDGCSSCIKASLLRCAACLACLVGRMGPLSSRQYFAMHLKLRSSKLRNIASEHMAPVSSLTSPSG